MLNGVSRRSFLKGAGGAVASLSLLHLGCKPKIDATRDVHIGPGGYGKVEYQGFQDIYRQKWNWDRVAKGSHYVNCWYQRGCNWNVYVKDGVVWREEQAGAYPQTNSEVPDFNPRGCQKGACYSYRMYDEGRLHYPLKRIGERGEGKWKRITWEEGLQAVADKMIDAIDEEGPGSIVWDMGTGVTNGCHGLGLMRSNVVLDTQVLDMNAEIGDHHPGALTTVGKICFASSADDMFYSDLILVWGGNPIYTQIPNAHFITEARYNGAKIVAIAPDYSASSIHADQWMQVIPGSDAALGLGMAHVMIEEGLYAADFIKEQTDFPFLVRKDTRRILREEDLEEGGADDVFYVYDQVAKKVVKAPKKSLALEGIDPALEGEFKVQTKEGEVTVAPSFAFFREHLKDYTPEKASKMCGTGADAIRQLGRDIANAKAATFLTTSNWGKYYHGLEMERAQILVLTLAGQIGKKGSGITGFPFLSLEGVDGLNMSDGAKSPVMGLVSLGLGSAKAMAKYKLEGLTTEMMLYEFGREEYRMGGFLPTTLFLYQHGGLEGLYGSAQEWDPHVKRPASEFAEESDRRGWQFLPKYKPRILLSVGGNILRRVRGYHKLYDTLLPKLDLMVGVDWRMSSTTLYCDYVFPAASWYEKNDITWATPIAPFTQVITAATEPMAESKPDWEIQCLLMKAVQERAIERGILTFTDRHGQERRLDNVYDLLTFDRRYTEENTEEFLNKILEITGNLDGIDWPTLKAKGFQRFTKMGMSFANIGNACEIEPGETITANTWHTENKLPWPTLTRRLQFYIDHDFYMELGEEMPTHKDDPAIGGDYPLKLVGGHARWSIHSSWRDEKHLLQLQRGVPAIYIGPEDARQRGIEDGETVQVRNDLGAFQAQAKLSAQLQPGQLMMYHAWEPFQFKDGRSHQTILPSPINPIQLAGGYFHLQPMMITGEPGSNDRGTRVEVEKVA